MNRKLLIKLVVSLVALVAASGASAADYVRGQLIVKFTGDATAEQRATALGAAGVADVLSTVRGAGGAKVAAVGGSVKVAIDRLERSAAVRYAEPNYIYRAIAVPNDPMLDQMWGLNNAGQSGGTPDADIDAPEGWDALGVGTFPQSGGAKIGIVDTGIQRSHPDLTGKTADCGGVNDFGMQLVVVIVGADPTIVDGKCSDDHGHGTHVAGTAAARTNNDTGVAGVAFNSPLTVCKGLNSAGSGTLEMVANCITWTNQRGAKVISMSLGGPGSSTLQTAVRNATNNGSLLVAAAGNGGNRTVEYPAGYAEVVSVGATDHNDQKASFSTFNDDVEIAAPGVNILSTWTGSAYTTISGTSMATPHVAGAASLIASRDPSGSPAQWRAKLTAAVDDLGAPGRDPQFGFGRVNLTKAP